MVGDTSTSTDPFPSSTSDKSLSVSSTSSLTSLASSGRATWPYTSTENTYTRLATPTPSSSTSVAPQDHPAEESNTSSRAISAGAAVSGIVGLLLAIAGTLAVVRRYLQRKRTKRTRMMRSSWFYGGDVREEERENEVRTEVSTGQNYSGPRSSPSVETPLVCAGVSVLLCFHYASSISYFDVSPTSRRTFVFGARVRLS